MPRVTILILCPECVEIVVLSNIKVKDIFHLKSTEFIQITNLIKSSADLRHDLLLVSKLNPKIYIYLWKILHNFSRSVFTLCVKHLQRSMKSIKSGTSFKDGQQSSSKIFKHFSVSKQHSSYLNMCRIAGYLRIFRSMALFLRSG